MRHDIHLQVGSPGCQTHFAEWNPWAWATTAAEAVQISRSYRARLRASIGDRAYAGYRIRKALCAVWKARTRAKTAFK